MTPFGQGRVGGSSEVFDRQGPAVRSLLRQDSVSYQLVSRRLSKTINVMKNQEAQRFVRPAKDWVMFPG